MALESDLAILQKTADYHVTCKKLRQAATGSILFGVLAVAIGIMLIDQTIFNLLLVVIGFLLLGVGVFNLIKPTAEGVVIDGVALIIVALWNVVFVALPGLLMGGQPEHIKWGVIGLLQIVWGVRRFMEYPKYRNALAEKPPAEDLERMEALLKRITKSKESEPGYFQFQASGSLLKGLLSAEAIVLIRVTTQEVHTAHRQDIAFEITGKALIGSKLKARLEVKDKSFKGTISPESAAKLRGWLDPEDVLEVEAVE